MAVLTDVMKEISAVITGLFSPAVFRVLVVHALNIFFILLFGYIGLHLGRWFIDRAFRSRGGKLVLIEEKRAATLRALLKSVLRYAVYFVIAIAILDEFNVSTASILAGAGVAGLAVGFGAQSLVKDVISGFFIIFENQFAVGEHVKINGAEGMVEELGLRVTKIKAWGGELHIIPNGQITEVVNFSRGNMRAAVEVAIAYEEDIGRALTVIKEVSRQLAQECDDIVEGPTVQGVTGLGDSRVTIGVVAFTTPLSQWDVERELRRRIKEAFDREGIQAPPPRYFVQQQKAEGVK